MTDPAVTREFNGLTIPAAGTYQLDPAHKRVGFVARHLMVAKVRGEFPADRPNGVSSNTVNVRGHGTRPVKDRVDQLPGALAQQGRGRSHAERSRVAV